MQIDLKSTLQTRFSLSPEQIEDLKSISCSEIITKQKSVETPTLIVIGGQEGSFKANLKKVALKELSNNAVVLSKQGVRKYHPNYAEIQAKYPDMLPQITDNMAKILLSHAENQAIEKRLNVILEASLGNSETIIQKITEYKAHQYQIDLRVMSIHKMFSYLNSEEMYELAIIAENPNRNISKQHHDRNFEAVEGTMRNIQKSQLLDKVQVFRAEIQDKKGTLEPKIVTLTSDINEFVTPFLQARNRDFSDVETIFLKSKAQSVLNMKIKREANFLEKVRFDANFKFILEGKGLNGRRNEKGISKS